MPGPHRRALPAVARHVVVATAWAVLLLVALEGTARLTILLAPPPPFSMAFAHPHEVLGYTARPESKWSYWVTPHGGVPVRIVGSVDASGLRPVMTNRVCRDCRTVLALGDSLTFGAESPDDQTWPEVLAHALSETHGRYRVRNVSFSGYSTLQVYLALREALPRSGDVAAVVYLITTNDPAETFQVLHGPTPILVIDDRDGVAIKPPLLGDWRKPEGFGARLALLSLGAGLFRRSQSVQRGEPADDDYRRFWTPTVRATVQRYLDLLNGSGAESQRVRRGMHYLLSRMAAECRAHGTDLFVAVAPFGAFTEGPTGEGVARLAGMSHEELRALLDAWHAFGGRIRDLTRGAGGIFLEVDPDVFAGMGYRDFAAVPSDWHYSAEANRRVGREIAEKLRPHLERR